MFRLRNSIQPYAWGSRTALAALQGRAPSATPEAELWMGAHPLAPSRLSDTGRSLEEAIAEAPAALLGAPLVARLGRELPYLVKLLAAQQPLSLQAHPDAQQAAEGFAAEEAAGVPRTAPHRNYKDKNPKPELVVALTPFEALCGFKPIEALLALERALDVPGFSAALAPLRASPDARGLAASFAALLHTPEVERAGLVQAVLAALPQRPGLAAEAVQSRALQAQYPGDLGIVSALLLQRVTLQPGEGLSLGAGNLHAYLSGLAVEVMANSDNVLRGGLTPKHVDVAQLLRGARLRAAPAAAGAPAGPGRRRRALGDAPPRTFGSRGERSPRGSRGRLRGAAPSCCCARTGRPRSRRVRSA